MQGGDLVLPTGGRCACLVLPQQSGRFERRTARRLSTWTRDYLREVALADLGCAVLGVFVAAQIRFGSNVTSTYLALSLALPVLWIAALWLAGAYDVRFILPGVTLFDMVARYAMRKRLHRKRHPAMHAQRGGGGPRAGGR